MPLGLIGLGLAAAGATAGAIGSAVNSRKAREERTRAYEEAKGFLESQYYRDPLSTTGNRALLKSLDERMRDSQDALDNRMVAGGATMENQLAAREANNRVMGGVFTNLLQGEDARRDAIDRQRLQLDQQYSQGVQQGFLQDAQNWQAWGAQMANAGMSLASSGLLSGYGSSHVTSESQPSAGAGTGVQFAPLAPAARKKSGLTTV